MTESAPPIVGIDLGTTYSLVAILQAGRPVVLANALGERLTPSAVSVADDDTLLVGAPARARATTHADRTVLSFKRDMGTERVFRLGAHALSSPALSSLVLSALKHDAEAALGVPIEEAVITVPAYFGEAQRQATRDAAKLAGLRAERIINEPTAAALAYGLGARDRELRAVVIDLGGGTFDVTALEIMEGVIEIQASAGDARLGGDDFDLALARLLASRIESTHASRLAPESAAWARLCAAAERAKRALSSAEETRVALPDLLGPGLSVELPLTRADAEEAWAPLLARMKAPIARCLSDARLGPRDVEEVLLVGGSTRMPCVVQLASTIFGRLPRRDLPPDEAVAMGAAVQAALKAGDAAVDDMVVTDVAPFTLGIETATRQGARYVDGLFWPILSRGTTLPASRVERFHTMEHRQVAIKIEMFQGEHSLCVDNTKLGELQVSVPPAPAGEECVDVRISYDLNGLLELEVTTVSTGRSQAMILEQAPGKLSAEEIEATRRKLAKLKVAPRELLPNRTALARADALFVELVGEDRALLGQAIARFSAALATQEPAIITRAREQLNATVASLGGGSHD
jgi:molecular chaperone HscC